jgi:hypothetical protein
MTSQKITLSTSYHPPTHINGCLHYTHMLQEGIGTLGCNTYCSPKVAESSLNTFHPTAIWRAVASGKHTLQMPLFLALFCVYFWPAPKPVVLWFCPVLANTQNIQLFCAASLSPLNRTLSAISISSKLVEFIITLPLFIFTLPL